MTVPTPGPPHGGGDPRSADAPRGDPREDVAHAMAGLDGLTGRPLPEHVEAFERVHAALGEALAEPPGPA